MKNSLDIETLKALAGEASVGVKGALELLDVTNAHAEDCETPVGRALFAAIEAKLRGGSPLDFVTLAASLEGRVPREVIVDVLTETQLGVTQQRLTLLRENSLRRQYLEALRGVARVVTDKQQPLSGAVGEAQRLLAQWQDETATLKASDADVFTLIDELEAVQRGDVATTIPTGIEALDAVIGGLQPTLTMVGALPGVGKSALLGALAASLARKRMKVGLLSLEDERTWLTRRLMAAESGVPVFVLANRPLTNRQMEAVAEAAPRVHATCESILIDDRSRMTVDDVVATARRMIARGCKAVLVDHLGEIALTRSERHDLDISDALSQLRAVAKTHRVPVIVAAHLKRREGLNRDSEPKLGDFAFSAGVERMARVALGLWRGEAEDELRVTVLKQTQGVSGTTITLNLNASAGLVINTAASTAALNLYGDRQ